MSKTVLPPQLNEELIECALQNLHHLKNPKALKIKVYDYKLSPANGEYFCSEIYPVEVQYELNGQFKQKSFIVKVMIPEMSEMGTNEEIMLKTILPIMERYLAEIYKENLYNKLHAKCLLSEREPNELYVLENLNSLGYYCQDRTKGLDFEHAKLLMEKIAKFHAASMMFNKKFPEIVKSILGSHFEKGACDDISQAITYGGFEYVANMIRKWPSYESLADKVLSIIPKYNELAFEVVNSQKSKFNVINHGDLWINNFLYKYDKDSNKPIDVLFVDFQLCFWGSCGFDINWIFNSSLELEVLRNKRQELIQIYYKSLKKYLEALKYPSQEIPTFEDVLYEIKRCVFIGFYIALCEFPIFTLAKSESQGLDISMFNQPDKMQELRKLLYNTPRVKETLKYSLKYFEEINLL